MLVCSEGQRERNRGGLGRNTRRALKDGEGGRGSSFPLFYQSFCSAKIRGCKSMHTVLSTSMGYIGKDLRQTPAASQRPVPLRCHHRPAASSAAACR